MRFAAAHTLTGHTHILRMDGKVFGLGRPIITVVQSTQSIMGNHATRGYVAGSAPWRSLSQPKVRAVLVMVGDVLGEQPSQVPLVESNHMVQQLAAAVPGPTFGRSEEHTSELQSRRDLVCRLLLEKKKKKK